MYELLLKQVSSVFENERNPISNASNFAALLFNSMENVNWVGFYFRTGEDLLLGPFQGNPACVRIQIGKGVCGTAAKLKETLVVKNVDEFQGHIACDPNSRSEIVVPLIKNAYIYGVLDIDSPVFNRFDENDKVNLEKLVSKFVELTDIEKLSEIY